MPWSNQGGGGQGPWGRPPSGGGGSGGGGGGGGGGGTPPDFEDLIRRGQDRFKQWMPGLRGTRGILLLILVAIAIWLASGFYRVQPGEQGVVMRFGKWTKTTTPGLNYHLPGPFEAVLKANVERVNRAEVGFRSVIDASAARSAPVRPMPTENLMLTGDENIIDIHFTVFWKIKDPGPYLFNVRNPDQMVKDVAESAMREVIGKSTLQSALAEGRVTISAQALELTQRILDEYGAGIDVGQVELQKIDPPDAVIDAFRDVQAARADQERAKNEAEAYRNDILPRAKGESERLLQEAAGYREEVVARANGETQRFTAVYEQYRLASDVTRKRLYLETMEQILSGMNKVLIDPRAGGGQGVVPYLPLPEIKRREESAVGGVK